MSLLLWLLLVPLIFAGLSALLSARHRGLLLFAGMPLQAFIVFLAWRLVSDEGPLRYSVGEWMAPLGFTLVADSLSLIMVVMTLVIALIAGFYAITYMRPYAHKTVAFWPLFWLLHSVLHAIWLAGDLFNLYIALELLTLIAVSMVILHGSSASLAAGLRYLYTALLSSLSYLLGVALIYSMYGTLDMQQLAGMLNNNWTTQVALLFVSLGLIIKTAIVPFHIWLPNAHGVAFAPISALHSALVVKTSFYILARLWLDTGSGLLSMFAAQGLGLLGAVTIFYGGYKALQQSDIKMLVAYSTVAQLGYLLLIFPLATVANADATMLAWQGGMLHVFAHAFAKAAMFLSVSTLVLAVGSNKISALAGISSHIPLSFFAFGLASVSLMGLPPSGGFNAKWLMLQSALLTQQWHWVAVLLLGSLLTATYVFKVFRVSFDQQAIESGKGIVEPAHWSLQLSAIALAGIAILLGFAAAIPVELMSITGVQP